MRLYCHACKVEHDTGLFGAAMQKQPDDKKRKCLKSTREASRAWRAEHRIKGHERYSFWKQHHKLGMGGTT